MEKHDVSLLRCPGCLNTFCVVEHENNGKHSLECQLCGRQTVPCTSLADAVEVFNGTGANVHYLGSETVLVPIQLLHTMQPAVKDFEAFIRMDARNRANAEYACREQEGDAVSASELQEAEV